MECPSDSSGPPQDVAVTGGTWSNTVMGTKIVDKSTVINNYSQGSAEAAKLLPQDAFQLSPGIIVYESNPISSESRIYRAKLLSKVVGDRDIVVKLLRWGRREEREAKIHFSVPFHENIVERIFTDTFKYRGQSTIYIAMECCDDQNMYDFVTSQARNKVAFDPDLYLSYAKQVAEGVAFLHSHKVMNRDLKPPNLLLAKNKTVVKIADFGMCKEIKPGRDDVTLTKTCPGTIGWSAPEILNGDEKIGLESDIYLLGLVFYFLWSYGKHPFGDDPHSWNHYIKHNENLKLDGMLVHNKAAGEELVKSMLQPDPKLRPNAGQVLQNRALEADYEVHRSLSRQNIRHTISQRIKTLCKERIIGEDEKQLQKLSIGIDKILEEEVSEFTEVEDKQHLSSLSDVCSDNPEDNVLDRIQEQSPFYVVATYDYQAKEDDELSFSEGEKMLMIEVFEDGWWGLKSQTTQETGQGPISHLVAEEWYAGKISSGEAKYLLLDKENEIGTFLIRKEHNFGIVLSLLAPPQDTSERRVVHHRVCVDGKFGTNERQFVDLCELVEHYKRNSGLECKLRESYKQSSHKLIAVSLRRSMLEVDSSSITFDEVIATGDFTTLWKGRWNDKDVAVKALTKGRIWPAEFFREAEVMKNLQHPNLLSLLAVVLSEPLYIVTELMSVGNLQQYLQNNKEKFGTEDHIEMATQISSGMNYLESMNYVHRDLCARNVFTDERDRYKIAGLAMTRHINDKSYEGTRYAAKWSAPEVMTDGTFSFKSDVWSFGVVLYEIVTNGELPYPDISNKEIKLKLSTGYRMSKPGKCPKKIYSIMQKCWKSAPTMRPSFKDLERNFIVMQTSKK